MTEDEELRQKIDSAFSEARQMTSERVSQWQRSLSLREEFASRRTNVRAALETIAASLRDKRWKIAIQETNLSGNTGSAELEFIAGIKLLILRTAPDELASSSLDAAQHEICDWADYEAPHVHFFILNPERGVYVKYCTGYANGAFHHKEELIPLTEFNEAAAADFALRTVRAVLGLTRC